MHSEGAAGGAIHCVVSKGLTTWNVIRSVFFSLFCESEAVVWMFRFMMFSRGESSSGCSLYTRRITYRRQWQPLCDWPSTVGRECQGGGGRRGEPRWSDPRGERAAESPAESAFGLRGRAHGLSGVGERLEVVGPSRVGRPYPLVVRDLARRRRGRAERRVDPPLIMLGGQRVRTELHSVHNGLLRRSVAVTSQ